MVGARGGQRPWLGSSRSVMTRFMAETNETKLNTRHPRSRARARLPKYYYQYQLDYSNWMTVRRNRGVPLTTSLGTQGPWALARPIAPRHHNVCVHVHDIENTE